MQKAFIIDDNVKEAVGIITDLLATPGEISIEYGDIKAILNQRWPILISTGSGTGNNKVLKACYDALINPWKETTIRAANIVLVNITGPMGLLLKEVNDGLDIIRESVSPSTEVIFGVACNSHLYNQARVTLLASAAEAISA